MKKDSYYFPHFYNARHDRKIRRIRKELGVEGYGIYFMLLEVLREQIDFKYPTSDIDLLADEFGTSEQKIKAVISKYDLFQLDEDNKFFSIKLIFYLQPYLEKSRRAREAINIRWERYRKEQNDTNVLQMKNKCYTSKVKYSKVKESKVKKSKEEVASAKAQTEEDFIKQLRGNYHWINVEQELKKMDGWLMAHPGRKKTRRFVINWLNKIDKPMEIKQDKKFTHASHQEWVEPDYMKGS